MPSLREASSERFTSSVTSAPAFRITCASPSSSPRMRSTFTRASMQATTASFLLGAGGGIAQRRTSATIAANSAAR